MTATTTLWRPVGRAEYDLLVESGMRRWPPRLVHQPIFYPVLNREYAAQIARDWNAKDEGAGCIGIVTEFDVDADYVARFDREVVGARNHEELWVPAEQLETFNDHIIGEIRVVEVHYGSEYRGAAVEEAPSSPGDSRVVDELVEHDLGALDTDERSCASAVQPSKAEFLAELSEIVDDDLFISDSPAEVIREARENLWCVSAGGELAGQLTVADLRDFVGKVVSNRRQQLGAHPNRRAMMFYIWVDEQAGQLRFSLVSDTSAGLPFGARLRRVDALDEILQAYLESSYLDGIPWEEFEEITPDDPRRDDDDTEQVEYVLDVFVQRLD